MHDGLHDGDYEDLVVAMKRQVYLLLIRITADWWSCSIRNNVIVTSEMSWRF